MRPTLERRPGGRRWRMSALAARPVAGLLCICLAVLAISPSIASALNPASAGSAKLAAVDGQNDVQTPSSAGITASEAQGLDLLLTVLPLRYANADPTHDLALAAVTRVLAQGVQRQVLASAALLRARNPTRTARAIHALDRLTGELQATTTRFQPWPLTLEVSAWSARARAELDAMLHPPRPPAQPYRAIATALDQVAGAAAAGRTQEARFATLRAFALYAAGPSRRLEVQDPSLDAKVTGGLLLGSASHPALIELLADGASVAAVRRASSAADSEMGLVAESLAEVKISHTTIVVDAAIIVFREGLEAVLILAAITASFVGAKRYLRRPVLLGALAGLGATALTWVIAQMILHLLSNGGLELQAVTGLIAIAVLLLVTNWFFHRVYWSQWISRFNRRRRALEHWDRLGFISGQTLGFVLLGLSSVYREGLETVLFLQALQTSAGTSTTLLGAGIGLGGTLIVGGATFKLQRKLPFKRMLIITGVLIALVLAVMVGTTVHNLQGIGWVANTPTSFRVPLSWNIWLGVYATWEGIAAQLGALVFVIGSYFAAREIQVKRPQRRSRGAIMPAPGALRPSRQFPG
jgi:high-affinity iron transporter